MSVALCILSTLAQVYGGDLFTLPGHNHDHEHGNHRSHVHAHSHGVYKHISHPNGPRTMIDEGVCCCFMSQFPDYVIEEQRRLNSENAENK